MSKAQQKFSFFGPREADEGLDGVSVEYRRILVNAMQFYDLPLDYRVYELMVMIYFIYFLLLSNRVILAADTLTPIWKILTEFYKSVTTNSSA